MSETATAPNSEETSIAPATAAENSAETVNSPATAQPVSTTETASEQPAAEKQVSEPRPPPIRLTPRPDRGERPERGDRSERSERGDRPDRGDRQERPERRPEPPRQPKPWVKPADFREAETSAIHQAVVHATEIAEALKLMTDRIDEILELVEVAERQKLVDERELDNLRRAMRRIQPPRQMQDEPQSRDSQRGQQRDQPRRDSRHESRLRQENPSPAAHSQETSGHESNAEAPSEPVESADPENRDDHGEEPRRLE